MQLEDILTLAAEQGMKRYAEKRGGFMLPLAVGAMLPGIVHKALERSESTEQALNQATGHPFKTAAMPPWLSALGGSLSQGASTAGKGTGKAMGGGFMKGLGDIAGAPASGVAHGLSDMVQKKLFGQELGQRQDALGMGGRKAIESFGSELGKSGVGLLKDIANKAMDAMGHAGDDSARQAILGELKRTDSVLANADDKVLMEAYHTMTRFAPVLSTDKNAVRSFLRQSVMSGNGPDFIAIKLLADSERAVTLRLVPSASTP